MPANIPSAIVMGGGQGPGKLEQLLLTLVSQSPQILMQYLNYQQNKQTQQSADARTEAQGLPVAIREANAAGSGAFNQLSVLDPSNRLVGEVNTLDRNIPAGLGDANRPTSSLAPALRSRAATRQSLMDQAPAELAFQRTQQGRQRAKNYLARDTVNGPQLAQIFDASIAMEEAGLPREMADAILTLQMPQSAKDKLSMSKLQADLALVENETAADESATTWLKQQGMVPQDAPIIPGAANAMLRVVGDRDDTANRERSSNRQRQLEKITDLKAEGLKYIMGRIGNNIGGSSMTFIQGGSAAALPDDSQAVTVEQAVAEWKSILQRWGDPGEVEAELARLTNGTIMVDIAKEGVISQVQELITVNPNIPLLEIRKVIGSGFDPATSNDIINQARARLAPSTPNPR